jgi:hypothetical protein
MPLSPARERPRLWHHDYLHLRPLLVSLRERLSAVPGGARVLDLGCGASPYRALGPAAAQLIRKDRSAVVRPDLVARVLRRGGVVLVSAPAAWPYDSAAVEHRWGVREIERVFPELAVREVRVLGGMLGLPFALLNVGVREAVRSAERRFGRAGAVLRGPAAALFLGSNLAGRALEILAARGPLASYLGYLDGRLPTNLLVIAERA